MDRISIQEIAAILTLKSGLKKKDAERFATTIFEVVKDGLESERLVKIKGLGTFKVIDIEARESVNVNTGERVLIEGHGRVTFTPDATMKELVNKPFSQFETVVLNDGVDFDDMDNSDSTDAETIEAEPETVIQEVVPEPVIQEVVPEPVVQEAEPEVVVQEAEPEIKEQEPLPILEFFENEQPEQPQEEEPADEDSADEEITENITEDITEEQEETSMNDNKSGKRTYVIWLLASLLACIGSFALGYYLGLNKGKAYTESPSPIIEEIAENSDTLKQEIVTPDSTTLKNSGVDEPAQKVAPAEPVAEVESPVVETPKQTPKQEEAPKAKQESAPVAPDLYEQMDARVRTGAYRIVGADYDVKVKAGETTARVAKRTLGPDMECYIEVFNGLNSTSELKEGQTLKIPKLELKKKKKQNK